MIQVNVTDLRQHLPAYLKRVEAGEEIRIISRGRVVARIQPEQDLAEDARVWLESLRGSVVLGDIISPLETPEWNADADNL
jgi:prevent-host-death family protein